MHFILDGYNVIKSEATALFSEGTIDQRRDRLIDFLVSNAPQGNVHNSVTIVFDGRWGLNKPRGEANIKIIFSLNRTADDEIVDLVDASPNKAEVVVVTNDRGIKRRIGGLVAQVLSVGEFIQKGLKHAAGGKRPVGERLDCETVEEINDELRKKWIK